MNDASSQTLEAVDIMQLLQYLPHRYPFLLVDRIIAIRGDDACIGIKNVTFNEPQFQGHFPGHPVMPGVFLIEGMAQTAKPKLVYFMTIDKAKFRKPVVPGDTVEYHMTKTNNRRNMWWYRGLAKVRDTLVCEAEVSAMVITE